MGKLPEPDDVDFVIGDVEPDPQATTDTRKLIVAIKRTEKYRVESEEADKILAAIGINFRTYGMQDAKSLLDHWHACVDDLTTDPIIPTDDGNGHHTAQEPSHSEPSTPG